MSRCERSIKWIKRNKDNIIAATVVLCGILMTILPLLKTALPGGYYPDLGYHLLRIEGVKDSIIAGEFPARIYHLALNGWGYGGSMFYQDYLLYIPALFRLAGLDIITAYKLFIVVITVLIAISTFFSVKYITCSNYISSLATISLLLSQYYIADIYNRVGVSEYMAFIFVPVLIAGIFDVFSKHCTRSWLIGIALFGLLLTHSITFALGVVLLLLCFIVRIPFFLKHMDYVAKLFKVAVITVLASAFVYVPLLEQMNSGVFRFHNPWAHVEDMVQPISTWFRYTGYFDTIAYVGVGIPILMCVVLRLFVWKRRNKAADIFMLCGIILIVVTSDIFPWHLIGKTPLNFIQFPYRLYSYAIPILTIGCYMAWNNIFSFNSIVAKIAYIFIGLVIALFGYIQVGHLDYAEETENAETSYFDEVKNTFYLGAEEWLPANMKGKYLLEKERLVLPGENEIWQREIPFVEERGEFSFATMQNEMTYQIPLLYYKGYAAELISDDGRIYSVDVYTDNNNRGDMYVSVPAGVSGTVKIFYAGTTAQKISMWISGITIIVVGLYLFYLKRKNLVRVNL